MIITIKNNDMQNSKNEYTEKRGKLTNNTSEKKKKGKRGERWDRKTMERKVFMEEVFKMDRPQSS